MSYSHIFQIKHHTNHNFKENIHSQKDSKKSFQHKEKASDILKIDNKQRIHMKPKNNSTIVITNGKINEYKE